MKIIGLPKEENKKFGEVAKYVESLNLGVTVEKVVFNIEGNELHTRVFLEDGRSSHQQLVEFAATYSDGFLFAVLRANSKKKVFYPQQSSATLESLAPKIPLYMALKRLDKNRDRILLKIREEDTNKIDRHH